MNINDQVKVTLTDRGLQVYRDHYAVRFKSLKKAGMEPDSKYYEKLVLRDNKELIAPLWELMSIFGGEIYHGSDQMFVDNEIKI